MEMHDFAYHRPDTLAEACRLGAGDAKFLAGGTELLIDFKKRGLRPAHVVSLKGIPELARIWVDRGGALHLGGTATLAAIRRSHEVRAAFPVLSETVGLMSAVQIRSIATIGGNFCGAVPCADTPPVCIVGGATLRLVGPGGEREVAAEGFFRGPRQTVLQRGEVLADVVVPPQPAGSGASYRRFGHRAGMSIAVASVAAWVRIEDGRFVEARIALGAVAPKPWLATGASASLAGQPVGEEAIARAAALAVEEAAPISDIRGGQGFRADLVQVLASRALHEAAARAGGAA